MLGTEKAIPLLKGLRITMREFLGAFGGKQFGGGAPDPLSCCGDQGFLSGQAACLFCHVAQSV